MSNPGGRLRVTDGSEPPCGYRELNQGPLQEHFWGQRLSLVWILHRRLDRTTSETFDASFLSVGIRGARHGSQLHTEPLEPGLSLHGNVLPTEPSPNPLVYSGHKNKCTRDRSTEP